MMEAWHIDSIDARAGLAFASWRLSDLELEQLDLDRSAVFLSPPFFQPEALMNRTIGFSAARGRGQLGVFVGGAELAFETLEDLTEFVRRAYVGSGSGDAGGGGGGGGGPPPTPDGPPPEVPEGGLGIEEEGVFQHPVIMAARAAADVAAKLSYEAGSPVKTHNFQIGSDEAETIAKTTALVDGATEMLLELLRRFPTRLDDSAIETWSRSAQSVGGTITQLELWADIVGGPYGDRLDRLVRSMLPRTEELSDVADVLPVLFGATSIDQIVYFRHRPYSAANWTRWKDGDPVDDLARWPLPNDLKVLAINNQDYPSVFSLMCAINANPTILSSTYPVPAVRAWSILLFAAAHLLAESRQSMRRSWLLPEAISGARRSLTQAAGNWLFQQWPKTLFPAPVELAIREASTLSP